MNTVAMVGRLTRDPETKTTTGGKNVAEFSIAVDKRFKQADGPDADFFRVKAWGQTADFVGNYLTKGRLVSVSGRLEQRKYKDKDGNDRESIEIVADQVNGLDKKPDADAPKAQPKASDAGQDHDPFLD